MTGCNGARYKCIRVDQTRSESIRVMQPYYCYVLLAGRYYSMDANIPESEPPEQTRDPPVSPSIPLEHGKRLCSDYGLLRLKQVGAARRGVQPVVHQGD